MDTKGMRKTCKKPAASLRSASQFQEPAVHHVRQGQSIQQKLDAMSAGDICVIHQGVYREPIKVTTRNVTIKASQSPRGDWESVHIHIPAETKAHSAVLFSLCQYVLMEGIKVQNDGGFAIAVSKCSPEILNCDVTGTSGGVKISKNNDYNQLYPAIIKCTIHNCHRGPGVFLQDAKAVIEDCEICHNNDAGIAFSGLSNPWICNNSIHSGSGAGIAVQNTAKGIIRDNTISNNDCAGIVVENGSHPVIWKNTLRKGKAEGIRIDSGSKGVISSNTLTDNASCEISVSGSNSTLVGNSFRDCGGPAVMLDKSSAHVTKNSFCNIDASCITIAGNGSPTVSGNTFSISSQPAITVGEHCNGSIDNNTFLLFPATVSSPAICKKRGTYVRVHNNTVKKASATDSPFDVSLQMPDFDEDTDTDTEDESGQELAAAEFPQARRHSAFAERISAMSKRNSLKSGSPDDHPESSDHSEVAAGSGGAAVMMRKHYEFPPSADMDDSPSPTAISDIHLGTIETPSLPVTPVHDDTDSQHSDKGLPPPPATDTDTPVTVNGKNHPLKKLPSKVKLKGVKVSKKSASASSTPSNTPLDPTPSMKKRDSATVASSTSWVDKTALRVLRAGSTGRVVARRSSAPRESVPVRTFTTKPACERTVMELSEYELQAELEAVRKLLSIEEQRQELQLLRNWLGRSRIKNRR